MRQFLPSGRLATGVNYWASHAGMFMWREWRPDIVRKDLSRLSSAGLDVLRVFPLWPDFQPLDSLREMHGQVAEFRRGEEPLLSLDGVSEEMLERFGFLADIALENGLQLVVALITGWMSGRFFAPPALAHLNALTDPTSIMWQVRFVDAFVRRFSYHEAIAAWDLGNECNCMGTVVNRDAAWLWTSVISKTIRAADPSRPVISGMHGLSADPTGKTAAWTLRDQGELTDILTTHPYPLFTPHCHREPLDSMRPLLHATVETCLYADLAGRPAFVEEFGTLGPRMCDEQVAAKMVRARLFDLWAHDCRGALWWCAYDQTELTHAPYDWLAIERELGLFRADGSAKPAVKEFAEFQRAVGMWSLPPRRIDAVCILTNGQDHWGVAFTCFILAKQAGFDIRFVFADELLPEAKLYLLPSIKGFAALSRRREEELWSRVEAGATLYVSFDENGGLGRWNHFSGAHVISCALRGDDGAGSGHCRFAFTAQEEGNSEILTVRAPEKFVVEISGAEVLAAEEDGAPLLLCHPVGSGKVFSLLAPMEAALALETGAFLSRTMQSFWKIYHLLSGKVIETRWIQKLGSPWIGITEHESAGMRWAVLTNYAEFEVTEELRLSAGFSVNDVLSGPHPVTVSSAVLRVTLQSCETAVWTQTMEK